MNKQTKEETGEYTQLAHTASSFSPRICKPNNHNPGRWCFHCPRSLFFFFFFFFFPHCCCKAPARNQSGTRRAPCCAQARQPRCFSARTGRARQPAAWLPGTVSRTALEHGSQAASGCRRPMGGQALVQSLNQCNTGHLGGQALVQGLNQCITGHLD